MNVPQQMKGAGHRGSIYGQATIANTRSCSICSVIGSGPAWHADGLVDNLQGEAPGGGGFGEQHLWRVDNHKASDPSASA